MKKYEEKLRCLKAKEEEKMKAYLQCPTVSKEEKDEERIADSTNSPAQYLLPTKTIKRRRDTADEKPLPGSWKHVKIDHGSSFDAIDNKKTTVSTFIPRNERVKNTNNSNSQKSTLIHRNSTEDFIPQSSTLVSGKDKGGDFCLDEKETRNSSPNKKCPQV